MNKKKSKKGFVKDFTNNNLTESAPQSAEPQQSNSLLVWFRYDSNNKGRSLSAPQAKHGITADIWTFPKIKEIQLYLAKFVTFGQNKNYTTLSI